MSVFSNLLRRLRRRDHSDDRYDRERDELSAQYTGTFAKNPGQEYGIKPPKIGR